MIRVYKRNGRAIAGEAERQRGTGISAAWMMLLASRSILRNQTCVAAPARNSISRCSSAADAFTSQPGLVHLQFFMDGIANSRTLTVEKTDTRASTDLVQLVFP